MSTAVVEDFCITSDKLDEWKEVLPKAGPKFRLGKYFDTIYEIPEFDAIREPEGGYLSCWDADTDIDEDDSNNLLFANIDGDSASVICLNDDEAIELIERWKAKEIKNDSRMDHQESSSKPGSDGTYEIVDGDEIPTNEHIYESIEDCVPEYQLFLGNDNTSPYNTPTHVTTVTQKQVSRKFSKTKRSNSLPTSSGSSPNFSRKYSDCSVEYSRLKRKQSSTVDVAAIRQPSSLPPPLPPPNNATATLFSPMSAGASSSDYSQLYRLNGKMSPQHEKDISPPSASMILKHKGKSYVLPITEKGKANKDRAKRQSSATYSSTTPKHAHSSNCSNNLSPIHSMDNHRHSTTVPRSVSMGFSASQPTSGSGSKPVQNTGIDTTPRRKSKHNSSRSSSHHSNATSSQSNKSQVTLYGVL